MAIFYLHQKEEIGCYPSLKSMLWKAIPCIMELLIVAHIFFHEISWHLFMILAWFAYNCLHNSFQRSRCCSPSVSAECAVIFIIYFESLLHATPFFCRAFKGKKELIIGKTLDYHLCRGIIFIYRYFQGFQIKKCCCLLSSPNLVVNLH